MLAALGDDLDGRVRAAAMAWLRRRCTPADPVVRRAELLDFHFEGRRFPLIDNQLGIRKPRELPAALSILTTYSADRGRAPYEDGLGPDGLLRYKYQGTDPGLYTNVGLRRAFELGVPLIWFFGVQPGLYLPFHPVWIDADEPDRLQVAVAIDRAQRAAAGAASPIERAYARRISRQRLHQPVFRERVIQAYETSCAMCRLRHGALLDAAHIIPDREERGIPAVSNGLALCKIHHAAYDANILGIRPDMVVQVRTDILAEIDGPMLEHGLQGMHDVALTIPRRRADRPDPAAIDERYERFRVAS